MGIPEIGKLNYSQFTARKKNMRPKAAQWWAQYQPGAYGKTRWKNKMPSSIFLSQHRRTTNWRARSTLRKYKIKPFNECRRPFYNWKIQALGLSTDALTPKWCHRSFQRLGRSVAVPVPWECPRWAQSCHKAPLTLHQNNALPWENRHVEFVESIFPSFLYSS